MGSQKGEPSDEVGSVVRGATLTRSVEPSYFDQDGFERRRPPRAPKAGCSADGVEAPVAGDLWQRPCPRPSGPGCEGSVVLDRSGGRACPRSSSRSTAPRRLSLPGPPGPGRPSRGAWESGRALPTVGSGGEVEAGLGQFGPPALGGELGLLGPDGRSSRPPLARYEPWPPGPSALESSLTALRAWSTSPPLAPGCFAVGA